jgi:acetoin utilization deacetylase AcuC-like enzyme
MIVISSPNHAQHSPPHEFFDGALIPVFESPDRVEIILAGLARAGFEPPAAPQPFGLAPLLAVHAPDYLAYLEHAYAHWVAAGGAPAAVLPSTLAVRWMSGPCEHPLGAAGYYAFDLSAPIVAGTWQAARSAADAALTGASLLLEGQRAAYALCRPPGHHAGRDLCGGYCFLNNAAIAAQYLLDAQRPTPNDPHEHALDNVQRATRNAQRVAILDIDFHHGNGTQQIFYERPDVLVASIHADPRLHYPYYLGHEHEHGSGAGLGFNLNIVLPPGAEDDAYLAALARALAAIRAFGPAVLVVSAGLDTFAGDPVTQDAGGFALSAAAYPAIGRRIAALDLPTLFVQEGGYGIAALGANVAALLRGFEE